MIDTESIRMTYTRQTKIKSLENRTNNILAFSKLDKSGLVYNESERMLLLHVTSCGEKIYIQYPGKETISSNPEKIRPWDFRPKLQLYDGCFMKDLSFPNIWDDLAEMQTANEEVLSVLAAIFFRMAFMEDYRKESKIYQYFDYDISSGEVLSSGSILFSWVKPYFPVNILSQLQQLINPIRGASLEAYLIYNDLLVQNEDCKYYYRDVIQRSTIWDSKVGRYNTLLSHISVIEYLQGKITFSEIMTRFLRGMGVAPTSVGRIPTITNNIITK
jgi:hypothetical protein